jgi:hypothetical protein
MPNHKLFIVRRPNAAELRADYSARFPKWIQWLITIGTGKAAVGEHPPRLLAGRRTKSALVVAQFTVTTALTLWLLNSHPLSGFLLLPITWLVQVNALRNMQVVIAHHAVHNELLKTKRRNYWLQVLVSTLSLTQHFEQYFDDHVKGHHSRKIFTTERDPDSVFLVKLGIKPGLPVCTLRDRVRSAPLSPRFHIAFLTARIRTNFITAPWHRKIVAALYVVVVAMPAFVLPWWVYLLGVVTPLVPLYHVAAFLQLLSEHAWTIQARPVASNAEYAQRCWGRFFLEPLPSTAARGTARFLSWMRWAARVVLVQVPSRFGVVIGDMPGHDLHHLYPAHHTWTRTLWDRQSRIDEDNDPRGMSRREFTSLAEVLDHVLHIIASTAETPTPGGNLRLLPPATSDDQQSEAA